MTDVSTKPRSRSSTSQDETSDYKLNLSFPVNNAFIHVGTDTAQAKLTRDRFLQPEQSITFEITKGSAQFSNGTKRIEQKTNIIGHAHVPLTDSIVETGEMTAWMTKDPGVKSNPASYKFGLKKPRGTFMIDWQASSGIYRLWNFDPSQDNPLPKPVVQEGLWSTIDTVGDGHQLIPIGKKYILDWVSATGDYRLWSFDPNQSNPLPNLVQHGNWSSIRKGHQLIPIRNWRYDTYMLDWVPATGDYRLWSFDSTQSDPLPNPPVQSGNWSSIGEGHQLIPIVVQNWVEEDSYILDWVPDKGDYRLWSFDHTQSDPLPDLLQKGNWSTIRATDELIPIGGYVLDRDLYGGDYRLWSFDPSQSDPLPNPPVQSGNWSSIGEGHQLIPIGKYILDWVPATGDFRLWNFDHSQSDPLPGPAVQKGTWTTIENAHHLISIGKYILDWVPATRDYRLWSFDSTQSDPLTDLVQHGTWETLDYRHQLIPIGKYVLDWVPGTGDYRLWNFDPSRSDPLPKPAVQRGNWSSIGEGHQLIPIGKYILDWVPATGDYHLWNFDPRQSDPLPDPVVQHGNWSSIDSGHKLISIGGYILDWVPATGGYHLWTFDPSESDPLPSPAVQSGNWSLIHSDARLVSVQPVIQT